VSGPRPALVLVVRADHPPAVPSRIVTCGVCSADCWLSKYSGDGTLALARSHSETGEIVITCSVCLETALATLGPAEAPETPAGT
jgi:hypothetical protein